ncbi:MAG TPA: class I SAM-dependent methyltransferase [Opitutaceae bacterium]|nr:class I SAM-dependent methyltransferase [Opitutaceae bacterium]
MNADEYANLEAVERDHWYYAGKRDMVRYWLNRIGPVQVNQTLLDCGAGTGIFARELINHCNVFVLDDHEESIRILRTHFEADKILRVSGASIPLGDSVLDYVTALDVLEHIRDDAAAVKEFRRILKPGGVAVVTVPASMSLWSDWDVGLHHFRRYDRNGLVSLFHAEQWDVINVNYTNVVVFPLVWLVRKWRGLRGNHAKNRVQPRTEDVVPPAWLNAILRTIFVGLGKVSWFRFPFGVSLILVARRRS